MNLHDDLTPTARARREGDLAALRSVVEARGRRRRLARGAGACAMALALCAGWVLLARSAGSAGASRAEVVFGIEHNAGAEASAAAREHEAAVAATAHRTRVIEVGTDPMIVSRLAPARFAPPVQFIDDDQFALVMGRAHEPVGVVRIDGRATWEGELPRVAFR
ncbi:MAG: hypothetical protein SFY69_03105 [Planctomycetota bacterium]|nr:hypothetical protein [Planctomycetota bacterium]